jgi:uncharacterized protein YegL
MDSQNLSMASHMIPGGNYGYTGVKVDTLLSPDQTVVTGLLDESGSTTSFSKEMEACVKEIVKALRHSPRADNLVYRHSHFGSNFREIHGFKPLPQINENDYDGCYQPGGCTALYDSEIKVIQATRDYCRQLMQQKHMCNAFIFVITDGLEYGGVIKKDEYVRDEMAKAIASEDMESMVSILIGVNDDADVQRGLKEHSDKVGFTQYVPIKDANEKTLAKLASFISRSISSQSQALGQGGPSQPLTF